MTAAATEQSTLFDVVELVHAPADPSLSIGERFDRFHTDNPWVYRALESLCEGWLAQGHKRVGVKQMFEVVRWQYGMKTTGDGGFRVNNDFTSRYARMLIEQHPEWADAIETRRLRAV